MHMARTEEVYDPAQMMMSPPEDPNTNSKTDPTDKPGQTVGINDEPVSI